MTTDFWPKGRLIPASWIAVGTKTGATTEPEVIFSRQQKASNSVRDAKSCHIHYYFKISIFTKGQQHNPVRRHRFLRRSLQRKTPWKTTSLLFLALMSSELLQRGWLSHSGYLGKVRKPDPVSWHTKSWDHRNPRFSSASTLLAQHIEDQIHIRFRAHSPLHAIAKEDVSHSHFLTQGCTAGPPLKDVQSSPLTDIKKYLFQMLKR